MTRGRPDDPVHICGQIACGGLAAGPIWLADRAVSRSIPRQDVSGESVLLRSAIERAVETLTTLMASQDDDESRDILEFQLAMLEDDALTDPAYRKIAEGSSADQAWSAVCQEQIDDYAQSADAYFKARASDFTDMRDRVLDAFSVPGVEMTVPQGAIVCGHDLTPSRFLEIDWAVAGGLALSGASVNGHVAILARSRGVPMLVGLDIQIQGEFALLDGEEGCLVLDPDIAIRRAFAARCDTWEARKAEEAAYLPTEATTASGDRVYVSINVGGLDDLARVDPRHSDGIGLVRSEFLFHDRTGLPGEAEQQAVYEKILAWAGERPVVVRTLDAGGDKPIPGLTVDGEANPFLGIRGIRLSLLRTDVFEIQIRALVRAGQGRNLKIMLPLVTRPEEFAAARTIINSVTRDLSMLSPPLGMMVEVPAAALRIAEFGADFFSIGTNDLIQYVTAADRGNGRLAELHDPLNPAVLELIARTVSHGMATGREVGVCGEMAGSPRYIDALLDLGIRSVSVAPAALASVKAAIARHRGDRHD